MNRNEFYKQLMSEYTFDSDKIRETAKQGNKRQAFRPLYVGISAAAAAMVVTVGTIAMTNLGNGGGVSLVDTGLSTLSASDRLSHALEQLEEERESSESRDFLVTFNQPLTPAEAQNVLTAGGNIPVKLLYLSDGSRVSDTDSIGKIFTENTDTLITGAAVYCTGSYAAELQDNSEVFLVEAMEDSDFESAAPVDIEDIDIQSVQPVQTTEATTAPQTDVSEPVIADDATDEAIVITVPTEEEMDGTVEPTEETSEMDGTVEPSPTEEQTAEDDGMPEDDQVQTPEQTADAAAETTTAPATVSTDTAASVTTASSTESPAEPEEQIPTVPSGVTLPVNVENNSYNTYLSADSAFFISDDVFLVKNSGSVSLYRYDGTSETLICTEQLTDAKVAWVSEDGGRLMMTGLGDFGTRSRTLLISAEGGYITDLVTDDIILSGSMTGFGYNDNDKLLTLCFREDGVSYIAAARLNNGNTLDYIDILADSENKLSLAASSGNNIYYTETADGDMSIYRIDISTGNIGLVHTFTGSPKLTRNLAFTHAVFSPDEASVIGFTEIFDPETETLIKATGGSVSFGASRHSFLDGESCCKISGGQIVEDGSIESLSQIEYRRSGSEKWCAYVSSGTVKITASAYSAENKSGLLTFSNISSNASDELTEALNGAIGVNNALAMSLCESSGIKSESDLIKCINAYYSANAAQRLMTKCNIEPESGSLSYGSGGLSAIDAADVKLVISSSGEDSASGTMYIESGTFGGRIAFRSMSVSFVKENGVWKLDCILK